MATESLSASANETAKRANRTLELYKNLAHYREEVARLGKVSSLRIEATYTAGDPGRYYHKQHTYNWSAEFDKTRPIGILDVMKRTYQGYLNGVIREMNQLGIPIPPEQEEK